MSPFVVIIPEYQQGHGLGHMSRALRLASALQPRASVYISSHAPAARRKALCDLAASRGASELVTSELPQREEPVLFVLDRRRLDRADVADLAGIGSVIAIDAGGPGRRLCDYLIDILPRVDGEAANMRDLRLLELPRPSKPDGGRASAPAAPTPGAPRPAARASAPGAPGSPAAAGAPSAAQTARKALVTFGGDDPAGMTERTVRGLLRTGEFFPQHIDVLTMPRSPSDGEAAEDPLAAEVNVIRGPVDLAANLPTYTHVFTSFGLTAFEAAAVGAEVILVNASRYHERLARRVGFRGAGVRTVSARRIQKRLKTGGGSDAVRLLLRGSDTVSLSRTISELAVPPVKRCPACGEDTAVVVGRFPLRTYMRCAVCGMVYLKAFEPQRSYREDYFFEEYRAQYGRTYLEDAEHIKAMGHRRLNEIGAAASTPPPRSPSSASSRPASSAPFAPAAFAPAAKLLDIGCAYGPFLSAAAERGYEVAGIDPSAAAVSYVTDQLGIPAYRASVDELADAGSRPESLAEGGFDVVTMWYVIEHLTDVSAALRTVAGLLKSGGVFAFSTPNLRGVSGRTRFREFLAHSPSDHFTIWSPRTARGVLARHGFAVRSVRVTGHHPERFPVVGARVGTRTGDGSGWWRRVLLWVSRVLRLGDTFEVYAVKTRQPHKGASHARPSSRPWRSKRARGQHE